MFHPWLRRVVPAGAWYSAGVTGDRLATPHVLREDALLADGQRGALVGPRGDISWMCLPGWDGDAVFAALLGGSGLYTVRPTGLFVWAPRCRDLGTGEPPLDPFPAGLRGWPARGRGLPEDRRRYRPV